MLGMKSKPLPADGAGTTRAELVFERAAVLPQLFGQFDRNLVMIENRLGVFITARGDRVRLEGPADGVSSAQAVLNELHRRAEAGETIDAELVSAVIGMEARTVSSQPASGSPPPPPPPPPPSSASASASASAPAPASGTPVYAASAEPSPGLGSIVIRTRKKTIAPRSATQAVYMQALAHDNIIFALGPAGTGKTYLAVAQAVNELIRGTVQRLILSRPAVEAGEHLGFLPGDMKDKVDPYLRPLYDALYDCLPAEQVERRIASGEIEVAPLAFMRGRTLADAFIILDEAQNTTIAQMKMFLTRFGMNSRMVVCGDPKQVDLPVPGKSGLADAVGRLGSIDAISVVRFGIADVVRHPIVGQIVEAYEGPDA